MYKLGDYLYNGVLYLNNLMRPRRRKLGQLMLYANTACQSRCRHCSIWRKPHEYLSLDEIKALMESRCITRRTTVGLEGGEFLMHPQAFEILEWFSLNHPNYTLLSNGLAPARLIEAVRKYHPRHVYISLDGDRESYVNVRGRDGYDKVIECVEVLKDEVPLSLMFCLTPWNSFEDMDHVIGVARRYGIDVRIGIYGNMDFFDTDAEMLSPEGFARQIPRSIHSTSENYDFVALYDQWRSGSLKLRCQSIFTYLVIHSNGDVPVCQNLGTVLGNIRERPLDDILRDRATLRTQRCLSKDCNGCWINFHRKYDIILVRNFERLLPKWLVSLFYGPYQWTDDPRTTYRKYLKDLKR